MENRTQKYEVFGKSGVSFKGLDKVSTGDIVQFELHNRGIGVEKSDYFLVVNDEVYKEDTFSYAEIMTFMGMLDLG